MEKYYNNSINDWKNFVINVINESLKKFGVYVSEEMVDMPMTGEIMKFTSNDLYGLYCTIVEKLQVSILIEDYEDFYNISRIAETLYKNFHKHNIQKYFAVDKENTEDNTLK